ncbi:MAG: hypothetical protein EOP53_10830 [Sphingobacteriales bacterium]|nr:MAG: hypothetical protein EOP53_10830 [Sphingobacteriales bacterium]
MKSKNNPSLQAGYGSQDFEQGRKGRQGGDKSKAGNSFNQFQNSGRGGFAGERSFGKNGSGNYSNQATGWSGDTKDDEETKTSE